MRRAERWLRLLRLVVACLFFVVARPAIAAETVAVADGIVLVAEAEQPSDEAAAPARATRARTSEPIAPAGEVAPLRALQSVRALRDRTYLLHCSLLR